MTISDYRNKLLSEINQSAEPLDAETQNLLALAGDKEGIGNLINVINDETTSSEEKISAIDSLNAVSNFSPALSAKMPEMVNALRGQMATDDEAIRYRAFATLASMKDEVAQERLLSELESDKKEEDKLVPTSMAISMLGADEKALPGALLREIALNPPDTDSLIEAVRHMPGDPESFDVLKQIMEEDANPLEARAMIPEMINNVDPPAFLSAAREMLQSKGTDHDLAASLAKGIAGITMPEAKPDVLETKAVIRDLMGSSPESFKTLANEILFEKDESAEQ